MSTNPGLAQPCVMCGAALPPGVKFCRACGYDAASGRVTGQRRAAVAQAASKAAKSLGSFALGCVLAAVGAVGGALIWAAVAYYARLEIGWIAWGLGGLAGLGMAFGNRKPGVVPGVTAATIAILGLLLAKAMLFGVYVYQFSTGDSNDIEVLRVYVTGHEAYAEAEKRSLNEEQTDQQWDALFEAAEQRVAAMSDEEVRSRAAQYREEDARAAAEHVAAEPADEQAAHSSSEPAESLSEAQGGAGAEDVAWGEMFVGFLQATFSPIDLLFIGLALFTAFRLGAAGMAT